MISNLCDHMPELARRQPDNIIQFPAPEKNQGLLSESERKKILARLNEIDRRRRELTEEIDIIRSARQDTKDKIEELHQKYHGYIRKELEKNKKTDYSKIEERESTRKLKKETDDQLKKEYMDKTKFGITLDDYIFPEMTALNSEYESLLSNLPAEEQVAFRKDSNDLHAVRKRAWDGKID